MSKVVVIRDLEFNWPSLATPKSPFGTEQWEVQVATTDKKKVDELKAVGINVREADGKYVANVKRKTKTTKGEPLERPKVVDKEKSELAVETIKKIGNGSRGAIKVFSYDWSAGGRTGTSAMLTEVQVTDLIEYNDESQEEF
jgi:hypothetical protein